MKKNVLKVLVWIISFIGGAVVTVTTYRHIKKINQKKETEKKRFHEEEYLQDLKNAKQERDARFIQDCKEGNVSKLFYEAFKDLFDLPDLPNDFVFPEDNNTKA